MRATLPDAMFSEDDAARSVHLDLARLDLEDLRSELWFTNREIAWRRFHRTRERAVNLPNGDFISSMPWLLERRSRIEAELSRRGRRVSAGSGVALGGLCFSLARRDDSSVRIRAR